MRTHGLTGGIQVVAAPATDATATIGALATAGSTSTTYPVTVAIESSSLGLFSGGEAGIAIVTGKAVGVTTVPTSSVQTVGTSHFVTVVNGTTTSRVKVTTGTVGAILTQVTSGVAPGQQVSMATIDQPVPTSSTTSTRTGIGGLGGTTGFPGGAGGLGGAGGFGGSGARGGTTAG
jgi:HlyD family secretion protein